MALSVIDECDIEQSIKMKRDDFDTEIDKVSMSGIS